MTTATTTSITSDMLKAARHRLEDAYKNVLIAEQELAWMKRHGTTQDLHAAFVTQDEARNEHRKAQSDYFMVQDAYRRTDG